MKFVARVFPHPNTSDNWACPICKKSDDFPVVLFPILGTREDNIEEAAQIHAACLDYGVKAVYQDG